MVAADRLGHLALQEALVEACPPEMLSQGLGIFGVTGRRDLRPRRVTRQGGNLCLNPCGCVHLPRAAYPAACPSRLPRRDPVLGPQPRNPAELSQIVGHQGEIAGDRLGGDEAVQIADGAAAAKEGGA